jgi:hypothetical protein
MSDFIERNARDQANPTAALSARRGTLRVATGFTG